MPDDVHAALRRVPFAVVLLIQNHRRHASVSPSASGLFVRLVLPIGALYGRCVRPHLIASRHRGGEKIRAMGGSKLKLKPIGSVDEALVIFGSDSRRSRVCSRQECDDGDVEPRRDDRLASLGAATRLLQIPSDCILRRRTARYARGL